MTCLPGLGHDWFGPSGGLAEATGFPDPPAGYGWYNTAKISNFGDWTADSVNLVWDFTRAPDDPNGDAPWATFPLVRGMMYGSAVAWQPGYGWTTVGPEQTVDLATAPVAGCITVAKPAFPAWGDLSSGLRWSWRVGGYPDEGWHFTSDPAHPEFTYWEEHPPLALIPALYLFARYYPLGYYYPPPTPCPDRPAWPYEDPYIDAGGGDGLVLRTS
jgi:hypothetical protein